MLDFDDVFSFFGTPSTVIYNTAGTKDMKPIAWTKTKTGYKSVCRTVGINPDDLKVEITTHSVRISGKTKYEDEEYSVNYEAPIAKEIISNIDKVEYKSLNGLTYIYIEMKSPEKKKVKIKGLRQRQREKEAKNPYAVYDRLNKDKNKKPSRTK